MRRGAEIAEGLVPGMLLAGIGGAIAVGLVVRLRVRRQPLVQIAVDNLVIEGCAHDEFRDQLGIAVAIDQVEALVRSRRLVDPEGDDLRPGHAVRPAGNRTLVGLARQFPVLADLVDHGLPDDEGAIRDGRKDRAARFLALEIRQHLCLERRVGTAVAAAGQLFQRIMQDLPGDLSLVGNGILSRPRIPLYRNGKSRINILIGLRRCRKREQPGETTQTCRYITDFTNHSSHSVAYGLIILRIVMQIIRTNFLRYHRSTAVAT